MIRLSDTVVVTQRNKRRDALPPSLTYYVILLRQPGDIADERESRN